MLNILPLLSLQMKSVFVAVVESFFMCVWELLAVHKKNDVVKTFELNGVWVTIPYFIINAKSGICAIDHSTTTVNLTTVKMNYLHIRTTETNCSNEGKTKLIILNGFCAVFCFGSIVGGIPTHDIHFCKSVSGGHCRLSRIVLIWMDRSFIHCTC